MMQSVLFILAGLVASGYGQPLNCDRGPTYWCLNAKTAEECGVTEFCQIMEAEGITKTKQIKKSTPESRIPAPAVNVSLYYESLCPGCRMMIRNEIFPTYETLKSTGILNINLYPYGNAYETKVGEKWMFDCQHGPAECRVNLVETCALHLLPPTQKLPFIHCVETTPSVKSGEACAKQLGIEWDPIDACYSGSMGNFLEHQIAVKTDALKPPHEYVPWITVNGVHTDDIQDKVTNDMLKYVCEVYTGPKPAQCKQVVETEKKRKRVEACYRLV